MCEKVRWEIKSECACKGKSEGYGLHLGPYVESESLKTFWTGMELLLRVMRMSHRKYLDDERDEEIRNMDKQIEYMKGYNLGSLPLSNLAPLHYSMPPSLEDDSRTYRRLATA